MKYEIKFTSRFKKDYKLAKKEGWTFLQNAGLLFGGNEVDGLPVISDVQLYLVMKREPGRYQDQADNLRDTLLNWSNA